jgi:acyl dehydratase
MGGCAVRTFETLADLKACVGEQVASSEWLTVTQQQIDMFAQATGDHQWIHTDVVRAEKGPFGTTIAHGFLTLSLLPQMMESAVHITHSSMGVNMGLNKVRFTSPVPVGSQLRAQLRLVSFDWIDGGGCQTAWGVTVERQGQDKPVCVAEILARRYP